MKPSEYLVNNWDKLMDDNISFLNKLDKLFISKEQHEKELKEIRARKIILLKKQVYEELTEENQKLKKELEEVKKELEMEIQAHEKSLGAKQ